MKKIISLLLALTITLSACSTDTAQQYEEIQATVTEGSSFVFEKTSESGYSKYVYNDEGKLMIITDFMDEGFSTYIIDGIAYTCNDNEEVCIAVSEDTSSNQDVINIISPYFVNLDDVDYTVEDSNIISDNYEYNVNSKQIDFSVYIAQELQEGYIKLDNQKIELPYEIVDQY